MQVPQGLPFQVRLIMAHGLQQRVAHNFILARRTELTHAWSQLLVDVLSPIVPASLFPHFKCCSVSDASNTDH